MEQDDILYNMLTEKTAKSLEIAHRALQVSSLADGNNFIYHWDSRANIIAAAILAVKIFDELQPPPEAPAPVDPYAR